MHRRLRCTCPPLALPLAAPTAGRSERCCRWSCDWLTMSQCIGCTAMPVTNVPVSLMLLGEKNKLAMRHCMSWLTCLCPAGRAARRCTACRTCLFSCMPRAGGLCACRRGRQARAASWMGCRPHLQRVAVGRAGHERV